MFLQLNTNTTPTDIVTKACSEYVLIDHKDVESINHLSSLRGSISGQSNFHSLLAIIVFFSGLDLLYSLQKTARFGQMIMMTGFMVRELGRYFLTFGVYFVFAILLASMNGSELKYKDYGLYALTLDLFQAYTQQ